MGKEKIEIIGVNVNGKITIALATTVEFMLMLYLGVQIASLNLTLRSGHVKGLYEGPFLGLLRLKLGWSVVIFSLFLLPTAVSGLALLVVFPTLLEGMSSWVHRGWVFFQWGLFLGILASGVYLVRQVHRTAVLLHEGDDLVL